MSAIARLGMKVEDWGKRRAESPSQDQTGRAFAFLWSQRNSYESEAAQRFAKQWLFERYCQNDRGVLLNWLSGGRKIILDAGCGAAYSAIALFGELLKEHDYLGVDISDAVYVAEERFREHGYPGEFVRTSILDLPLPSQSVDIIFSEGVLHHTDDTEKAFKSLVRLLKKGGRFLFYVYAKKPAIREYSDDYIRRQLQPLSDSEAWEALYPLTKLGIALGNLRVEVDVPEDIPMLGIKKGKIDLQRFVYWNICKMFYRDDYSIDEMNHMNYDWFRPLNCRRHDPEEVKKWCADCMLAIEHMDIQDAGITVVARKVEDGVS